MNFSKLISISFLSTILSFTASAGLIDYAVVASVNGTSTGGDNIDSTYNEVDGQNKALASLSGGDLLPTLKVMSQSSDSAYSGVIAVQKFTYDGSEASDFFLNFNLHGDVNSGASSPLRADIGVMAAEEVYFYSHYGFATNFFEGGDGDMLGYESLFLGNGMDQNASDSISFNIQPGESFFVYASMEARATNGIVDAWNTLSMNFTDSTGLTAGSFVPPTGSIPEPSNLALLLVALFLISRKQLSVK